MIVLKQSVRIGWARMRLVPRSFRAQKSQINCSGKTGENGFCARCTDGASEDRHPIYASVSNIAFNDTVGEGPSKNAGSLMRIACRPDLIR